MVCLNYTCKFSNSAQAPHPEIRYDIAEHAGNAQRGASGCWSSTSSDSLGLPALPKSLGVFFSYLFLAPVQASYLDPSMTWSRSCISHSLTEERLQHSFNLSHRCCPSEIEKEYTQASLHVRVLSSGLLLISFPGCELHVSFTCMMLWTNATSCLGSVWKSWP